MSSYAEQRLCVPLAPDPVGKLTPKECDFWTETAQ